MIKNWVDKIKGQRYIFYIFVGYIFLFLFWWCYLLYSKITEIALEKFKYYHLLSDYEGTQKYLSEIQHLEDKMHRDHIMIVAEGITFFIILLAVVYRLKKSINKELEVAKQQKNFMLSITHELKSPIASTSLNIQTLLKRDLDDSKKHLLLSNSAKEIERLNDLVNKILLASKMESDFFTAEFNKINLSDTYLEITNNFKSKEESLSRMNTVEIEPDISINGDKTLLQSLLINLIDNALKYSEKSLPIEVSLTKNETHIIIKVRDYGKGISEKDKKNIFKKFYRAGDEEIRTHIGTGLGLYLVKQIVDIHGGNIFVQNIPNEKGTLFEVCFSTTPISFL